MAERHEREIGRWIEIETDSKTERDDNYSLCLAAIFYDNVSQ